MKHNNCWQTVKNQNKLSPYFVMRQFNWVYRFTMFTGLFKKFCIFIITRHLYINAFHAAGECRRQVIDLTYFVKNVNILEFHGHIWNHHEKYIQQSTNMPGVGSLIREIDITISKI